MRGKRRKRSHVRGKRRGCAYLTWAALESRCADQEEQEEEEEQRGREQRNLILKRKGKDKGSKRKRKGNEAWEDKQ